MPGGKNTMPGVMTIFLVDDDVAVCHALSVFLEASGYGVKTFLSAESFLKDTAGCTVDGIILLDQCMTGMSGLELQLKLARRGIALPIIFITGYMDEQIYTDVMKAGAFNFLQKPFSNEDLLESIGEVFSNNVDSSCLFTKEP